MRNRRRVKRRHGGRIVDCVFVGLLCTCDVRPRYSDVAPVAFPFFELEAAFFVLALVDLFGLVNADAQLDDGVRLGVGIGGADGVVGPASSSLMSPHRDVSSLTMTLDFCFFRLLIDVSRSLRDDVRVGVWLISTSSNSFRSSCSSPVITVAAVDAGSDPRFFGEAAGCGVVDAAGAGGVAAVDAAFVVR